MCLKAVAISDFTNSVRFPAPLQPLGTTAQAPQQAFNGFPPATAAPPAATGADKYSNLSDLFSTGSTAEETPSTGIQSPEPYNFIS